MESGFLSVLVFQHTWLVAGVLYFVLAGVVTVSLLSIVGFALFLVIVSIWTAGRPTRDPLAEDLDRVLAEILGPRGATKRV